MITQRSPQQSVVIAPPPEHGATICYKNSRACIPLPYDRKPTPQQRRSCPNVQSFVALTDVPVGSASKAVS